MTTSRLTSPSQAITAELLHRRSSVAVAEIADRLAMSSSMVRHRLPEVRRWVQGAGGELVNTDGGRLELVFGDNERAHAQELLAQSGLFLTGAERRSMIFATLLLADDDIQADELSATFDVSRTTLFADLRILRGDAPEAIALEGAPGKGVRLIADELTRRRLLAATLASTIGDDWPWHLADEPRIALLPELRDAVSADIADQTLDALTAFGLLQDSEGQGAALVGYLVTALARFQSAPLPTDEGTDLLLLPPTALSSASAVWQQLTGSAPEAAEQVALARHIAVAECLLGPSTVSVLPKLRDELTELIADTLSDEVAQQPAFTSALEQHLRASLPRLVHGIELDLPQRTDLRLAYPYAHVLASRAISIVQAKLGVTAPVSEIASFAMLIAAFTERAEGLVRRPHRVVIVCNSGVATALLLRERILREMPDLDIISVLSHSALARSPELLRDIELILTTAVLTPSYPAPVIRVSPLLTAQDIRAIDRVTSQHQLRTPTTQGSERISMDDFTSTFDREACAIGVHATDWQDAMRKAGSLLVKAGAVDESYVQATIDSVLRYGPYIVMAPGVALPHANNESNVHRTCFGLMTLAEPVAFESDEKTELIDVLIPMAAADGKDHVGILAGLARSLQDDTFVVDIRAARDSDEALAVLRTQLTGGNA